MKIIKEALDTVCEEWSCLELQAVSFWERFSQSDETQITGVSVKIKGIGGLVVDLKVKANRSDPYLCESYLYDNLVTKHFDSDPLSALMNGIHNSIQRLHERLPLLYGLYKGLVESKGVGSNALELSSNYFEERWSPLGFSISKIGSGHLYISGRYADVELRAVQRITGDIYTDIYTWGGEMIYDLSAKDEATFPEAIEAFEYILEEHKKRLLQKINNVLTILESAV